MSKGKKYLKEQEAKKKSRATDAYRRGKGRIKVTTKSNNRGAGKLASGTGETERRLGDGVGEINTKVAGSAGSYLAKNPKGGSKIRYVREKAASEGIKKKGVVDTSPKPKKQGGRLVKKADGTLDSTTRPKAKSVVAKKKKKAAESKTPINYGTPMNYSMKPGSREKDSPGAFRDTPINKYMGSPVNYGTESPMNDGHDKKRKLGTEGMSSDEKVAYYKKQSENMKKKKSSSNKAPRGPQNISTGGVKARASVKGRSEKNTDLLDVAKKGIKKIFG